MNAGQYRHKISIYTARIEKDAGFQKVVPNQVVLTPMAEVKTTRGFTMIKSGTDFEEAYTNFTIRYPHTEITRDMLVVFNNRVYSIEYLNNVDYKNVELEMQCKEVTH